ncbi:hypothetical protein BLNAU_20188 [Blattamonas nauphoetae]|uniref:Uncharacterized protein n=1 Tax=Blattamonas nauphoetae TaxID=2049346 RepID=A0ABQ9X003_9EUKA|nr:hypothetical protein BLNAU_20188 [Blattamonas nauphoetae]
MDTLALTLLPSPIFPSSSPHQQYSNLSFLAALSKKVRMLFSSFQRNIPTDPSRLQKFIQLTTRDQFIVVPSLDFCMLSLRIPLLLLRANPQLEVFFNAFRHFSSFQVDSEIIREFILFVKEALTTILTNISTIDTLIASLPPDSSPTTSLVSANDAKVTDALKRIRNHCQTFSIHGWNFFVNLTCKIAEPHKSSFQTIVLDDPSFPDLILNSLKLQSQDTRRLVLMAISNILLNFQWLKEKFMTVNLVGRMFETVDFVSLPLSESETLLHLTNFFSCMLKPIGDDEEAQFEQYRLIRVSVFEPAKQFFKFIFRNSDKLVLNESGKTEVEKRLSLIHLYLKNMELRSDEHNAGLVYEFVNYEIGTMVEMENEAIFRQVLHNRLNRTWEWNRNKRERQKRREVLLREEGWDDGFELRVVGIEVDTNQNLKTLARAFRSFSSFNSDPL